jgi:hypothetical protein
MEESRPGKRRVRINRKEGIPTGLSSFLCHARRLSDYPCTGCKFGLLLPAVGS